MNRDQYRMIVIGAGITGLSTALAYKKVFPGTDEKIIILERNPVVGGCVSTFSKGGYSFDTAQIIPDVSDLLDFFDIDIILRRFEGYFARIFMANPINSSVKIIKIPSSIKEFEKNLVNRYPNDRAAINAYFTYCRHLHAELKFLKTEPKWYQLPRYLFKCRKIQATSNKTFHKFLYTFNFKNPDIFKILDTFSSFIGLSGDRCAALLPATTMVTALNGSFRPLKGFIQFPLALQKSLEQKDVEVRINCKVMKILVKRRRVIGVELESGEKIFSKYVVCTADTKYTFENLLGVQILKKAGLSYYRKMDSATMSPSGFTINIGLDNKIDLESLGFKCGFNLLSSGMNAFEVLFNEWEKGNHLQSDSCFHLTVTCPSLMTGGKSNLIIHVYPVPAKYWIELREKDYQRYYEEKNKVAHFYINKVEQYMVQGLSKHILLIDISTPATFKRQTGSPTGSYFDMLPVPSNFERNRLKTRTPVKGFFVPKFSHGIWHSMQAGLHTTDMIAGGRLLKGNKFFVRSISNLDTD